MFKFIQITDCHLLPAGETVFGSDPQQRLEAAIADINDNHADAGLCVLTGDLAHRGDPRAYQVLRAALDGLEIPCRLLPGNHDDRPALAEAFPALETDAHGFIQSWLDTDGGRFVFLDSVDAGVHTGAYCARRSTWLVDLLEASRELPVYLFLHHAPFPIELPHIDKYAMRDGEAFGDLIAPYANIRHLFFGHVHRPVSGSWRGIPFSALRGTNHQSWLDFAASTVNVCSLEPPAYAVVFLDRDRTVVHFHDFLDASPKYIYDPAAAIDRQVRLLES